MFFPILLFLYVTGKIFCEYRKIVFRPLYVVFNFFFFVNFATGNLSGILILVYLGVISFTTYHWLKYILALQLNIFLFLFLYSQANAF